MLKKLPVSSPENIYNNVQAVDSDDLTAEQEHNKTIHTSIINNHFGSGIILVSPDQNTIFDSNLLTEDQLALLNANNFDGVGLSPSSQPSDVNFGNQLEITLTDSLVVGRFSVKVAIIGLNFNDELQIEKFYFYKNETQVTRKHYKRILSILFNDFKGNNNCSRNLGGRITIKEAKSFQLSRDAIMVSQDVEPDLFWRDFKLNNPVITLSQALQTAIGSNYNVDSLNINTTSTKEDRVLLAEDVTTQIGQKFIAKTDNIQKISLLLSVNYLDGYVEDDLYDWEGDLVFSVYSLQSTVDCPTDIVPNLAIDFEPNVKPLAQLSFNQQTLKDAGYILNDLPQPVDFVLSGTSLGKSGSLKIGSYYAFTLKRSGAANLNNIRIGSASNLISDSMATIFSGESWVDLPEEDLWFKVWTDAVKVSDGLAYERGQGIQLEKTKVDSLTGQTIDYEAGHYIFNNTGYNNVNVGILKSVIQETSMEQDVFSGNNVFSRRELKPEVELISVSEWESLKQTEEPLVIGSAKDLNPKLNNTLTKTQAVPGLVYDNMFIVVNPDPDLLSLNLIGSNLTPNTSSSLKYKIVGTTRCTNLLGDVNGDGIIDSDDVSLISELIGESLYYPSTQQKIIDGYFSTLQIMRADVDGDGYVTSSDANLLLQYVTKSINSFPGGSSFLSLSIEVQSLTGRYDGYYDCDGYVRLDGSGNLVTESSLTDVMLSYYGYNGLPQLKLDSAFTLVPFQEVEYQIVPQPFWQDYFINISSDARLVPVSFVYTEGVTKYDCQSFEQSSCSSTFDVSSNIDPGRNDLYVPYNLIIDQGQILTKDQKLFKQDIEIGTIELRLPAILLAEASINIFEKLVADAGSGKTIAGYNAMRYSDCSTVQLSDLALNRVKFEVSIQSFYKQLDGYDSDFDGYVVIDNPQIGCYIDHATGILTLNAGDLAEDSLLLSLVTKISITVFLKKAGWNNNHLVVTSDQIQGLIS